jgi:RNA polymerase sigma-70 factor (ECF subfamily)
MDAGDVYRRLAPAVLGYLRSQRVPDPEDVLGEVFLSVARSLPRFRGDADEDLRRWVFTIARNRVVDDVRRRARRPPSADEPPTERAAPADDLPMDAALLDALSQLSPPQREVVALRFVADLALEDVARVTRRSVAAVKSLQHRGLVELARTLSDPRDAV